MSGSNSGSDAGERGSTKLSQQHVPKPLDTPPSEQLNNLGGANSGPTQDDDCGNAPGIQGFSCMCSSSGDKQH